MKGLCFVVLVQLVVAPTLGLPASQSTRRSAANDPEALVRSLYEQVVAHPPGGLLSGASLKSFAPYLSRTLLHRNELTRACARDWFRQNRGRIVKAPFAWGEAGLFSGPDERTGPMGFRIKKSESETDGTYRVYVKLKWWETSYDAADAIHHATSIAQFFGMLRR